MEKVHLHIQMEINTQGNLKKEKYMEKVHLHIQMEINT